MVALARLLCLIRVGGFLTEQTRQRSSYSGGPFQDPASLPIVHCVLVQRKARLAV
jgi:hypothetical protein